jgi:hypothetical protein
MFHRLGIHRKPLVVAVLLLTAVGCASMQGQVASFSRDYSIAMEQFQNREIVTNILRARDRMPLHFAELSQINGSLQEQIQLGASINWGPGAAKNANTASPQIQFQSSPTFTTSPLDTQAFAVGMMQPIDASYFANYWQQRRLPKKLLFRLFIDSIKNADGAAIPGHKGTLRNDPEASSDEAIVNYREFEAYMEILLARRADFQAMTIMTPFGEPFQFDVSAPAAQATYKLDQILSAADEISVHLGKLKGQYHLFRRWDEQLVMCYDARAAVAISVPENIRPYTSEIETNIASSPAFGVGKPMKSFLAATKGGSKPGGNQGNPQTPSGSSKGPGAPGAAPQIASPVIPLAAMLPETECAQLEYYTDPLVDNEDVIATNSAKDVQFRLRSVKQVIEYLGAMLRPDANGNINPTNAEVFGLAVSDTGQSYDVASRFDVDYSDRKTYHVGKEPNDYASQILGILTELVNARKLSSDIATTKQVQVIP